MKFIFTEKPAIYPSDLELHVHEGMAHDLSVIPDGSVRCWVTSPPYWKKFDYGVDGQSGLEETVAEYIEYQQCVAMEMLKKTRDDGNLFWNIHDTSNGSGGAGGDFIGSSQDYRTTRRPRPNEKGWWRKAQLLIPERTRIGFADAGWVPRLSIVWDKQDARRGAEDRPSYSYEHVLVFSKSVNPYWNRGAVLTPYAAKTLSQMKREYRGMSRRDYAAAGLEDPSDTKRRMVRKTEGKPGAYLKSVWQIASGNQPTVTLDDGSKVEGVTCMPLLLAEICINLGSAPGDLVGDPYCGMGTTLVAAKKWGRHGVGIELNPRTAEAARVRIRNYRR